jgi:hypothetical protein
VDAKNPWRLLSGDPDLKWQCALSLPVRQASISEVVPAAVLLSLFVEALLLGTTALFAAAMFAVSGISLCL